MQLHTTSFNSVRLTYLPGLVLMVGLLLIGSGSAGLLFGPAQPGPASPGQVVGASSTSINGPDWKTANGAYTATQSWTNPQPAASTKLTVGQTGQIPAGLYNSLLVQQ